MRCVQMTLIENKFLGKWIQKLCQNKALVVCQRKPMISKGLLFNEIKRLEELLDKRLSLIRKQKEFITKLINHTKSEELEEEFRTLDRDIGELEEDKSDDRPEEREVEEVVRVERVEDKSADLKNFTVEQRLQQIEQSLRELDKIINHDKPEKKVDTFPLLPKGFIYTQLPNQTAPETLFPGNRWREITRDFAGLFFRAEGGDSAPFGFVQSANSTGISEIRAHSSEYSVLRDVSNYYSQQLNIRSNQWTNLPQTGRSIITSFNVFNSGGEVRPINTAIKIWITI